MYKFNKYIKRIKELKTRYENMNNLVVFCI